MNQAINASSGTVAPMLHNTNNISRETPKMPAERARPHMGAHYMDRFCLSLRGHPIAPGSRLPWHWGDAQSGTVHLKTGSLYGGKKGGNKQLGQVL